MLIFFSGTGVFLFAFIVHLIIWRICVPERQLKVLLTLFTGVFAFTVVTSILVQIVLPYKLIPFPLPSQLTEYIHIGLLYVSLSMVYIEFFTALDADSPSIFIILAIAQEGGKGMKETDLQAMLKPLKENIIIMSRIGNMLRDEMICEKDGKYIITQKGMFFIFLNKIYRWLVNNKEICG